MNRSTIPYSIVEERRRLNKCIENAPNEWEREIYKKIRDMKIPYDKLDTILETSKELIKKKEKQRKKDVIPDKCKWLCCRYLYIYFFLWKKSCLQKERNG